MLLPPLSSVPWRGRDEVPGTAYLFRCPRPHLPSTMADISPTCRSGVMPDRKHIYSGCGLLLIIELAVFIFMIAGTHGLIVPLKESATTDFVSFYAAGSLAVSGSPQLAYNADAHRAAEEQTTAAGITYNFFYYPPTFLLLCAALAHLPYLVAFLLFETVTLCLYLFAACRILGEPGRAVIVPLLAFAPVLWTLGLGQNSLLTAALFGAGTLLVDRRPVTAGLLFGVLCYKPQFALLVPVALAAGKRWLALWAVLASAVALSLLSLALFGWQTWHDFIIAAAGSSAIYMTGRVPFTGYINPLGAVRELGGAPNIAYAVQTGAILTGALLVALVWRRGLPLPLRAATLSSATLVAAPLVLFYDLTLGAVAALWLIRADGEYRLAEWQKVTLAVLFLLSLAPRISAEALHFPVGSCIALALLTLVAARALESMASLGTHAMAEPAGDSRREIVRPSAI
jgi:alpha-1,2-mannosyltransferase